MRRGVEGNTFHALILGVHFERAMIAPVCFDGNRHWGMLLSFGVRNASAQGQVKSRH